MHDYVRDKGIRLAVVWHCACIARLSGRCLVTGGMAGFVHVLEYVWHVLSCDWLLGWHSRDFK